MQSATTVVRKLREVREILGLTRPMIAVQLCLSVDTVKRMEDGRGTQGHLRLYCDLLDSKRKKNSPRIPAERTSYGFLVPDKNWEEIEAGGWR